MSDGWLRGLGIDWEVVGSDFWMSSFSFSAVVISGWWMLRPEILCDFTSRRTTKIWLYRWLFNSSAFDRAELRDLVNFSMHSLSFHVLLDSCDTFCHVLDILRVKKCFTVNDWNISWMCCSTRSLKYSSRWKKVTLVQKKNKSVLSTFTAINFRLIRMLQLFFVDWLMMTVKRSLSGVKFTFLWGNKLRIKNFLSSELNKVFPRKGVISCCS